MADKPLIDIIAAALRGGARWFLLREPDLQAADRLSLAASLEALCAPCGARLSVSADLAAAAAIQTTGIHLPQRMAQPETVATARAQLGPDALIGISAHSRAEAAAAQNAGVDYVTLSPVFLTDSKPGYGPALGPDGFRSMATDLDVPAVALGGIAAETIPSVRNADAAGIAVMGGVMRADDPETSVIDLISAWENGF